MMSFFFTHFLFGILFFSSFLKEGRNCLYWPLSSELSLSCFVLNGIDFRPFFFGFNLSLSSLYCENSI